MMPWRTSSRPGPYSKQWALAFVGAAFLVGAWVLAAPLFSGPDEPAHVSRAASLWSGNAAGTYRLVDPTTEDVPRSLVAGNELAACSAFKPKQPACKVALDGDRTLIATTSAAASYPPLYYAIVGLPLRASPTNLGMLASRAIGGAVVAALLATALSLAARIGGRLGVIGVLVAFTPTAAFLGGVINPSGLEIASALTFWCACVALFDGERDPLTLGAFGASGFLLAGSRPVSPGWIVAAAGTTAALLGFRAGVRVLSDRRLWPMLAPIALSTGVVLFYLVRYDAFFLAASHSIPPTNGYFDALGNTLHRLPDHVEEIVGVFGWLDISAPRLVRHLWVGLLALFAALGAARATKRQALLMAAFLAAAVLVPPALDAWAFPDRGFVWQGRYGLPFLVGLPVLAGYLADRAGIADALGRRFIGMVAGVLVICHAVSFWWALRRYVTGTEGPAVPLLDEPWAPPVHAIALVVAAAFGAMLLAYAAVRSEPIGRSVADDAVGAPG